MRVDPPSQCWASHVNTILVQTLIAKIFSTKASTNTLELSRIVLSRNNLISSQSSSDNVAKPSISKLEIPFRAHYRTKWRHFVFDRPFGRARADKMPICYNQQISRPAFTLLMLLLNKQPLCTRARFLESRLALLVGLIPLTQA